MKAAILSLWLGIFFFSGLYARAQEFTYCHVSYENDLTEACTVIGDFCTHTVASKETLLDIARTYGLGFNEIALLYPYLDPWIPKQGLHLSIPTQWILPPTQHGDIVINIPEMRLYRFSCETQKVKTYPVAIGDVEWKTPVCGARVVSRVVNPSWTVPPSLRKKYKMIHIPPGPENPLGKYWVGLSNVRLGLHGTHMPWGVGRMVSHGCIRLYPEHMEEFYGEAVMGAIVEIIYEPVKVGVRNGRIYMEVHPDVYRKSDSDEDRAFNLLKKMNCLEFISPKRVREVVKKKRGIPECVGKVPRKQERREQKKPLLSLHNRR